MHASRAAGARHSHDPEQNHVYIATRVCYLIFPLSVFIVYNRLFEMIIFKQHPTLKKLRFK